MARTFSFALCLVACGCVGSFTIVEPGETDAGTGGVPDAGGTVASGGGGAPSDGGSDGGTGGSGGHDAGGLHPSYVGSGVPMAGTIDGHGVVNPNCGANQATIESWTIPTELDTFFMMHTEVTVTNTGTSTWTDADQFFLGDPANVDPFIKNARASLPNDVAPGQTVTFTVDLRGPQDAGAYVTQWQMVQEHVCWFGDRLSGTVQVDPPVAHPTCDNPAPHGLDQFTAVVHIVGPTRTTLDSTPKVCDRDYCSQIGFTDFRNCCPPRPEGHPDVDVCNEAIVGRAPDTGRVGPTWTFDGLGCGTGGTGNCEEHPDNQFLLWVFGPGTARACGNLNPVCGQVVVTQ